MTTAVALMAGVCMPAQAADKKITIAGILQHTQDPFWSSMGCGAEAKAKELGVELKMFSSTTMDAAPITANFNAALLFKPDGIFANPANPNQFVTQYSQLMKAGTPVVTGNGTQPPAQLKIVWSSGDTKPYLDETLQLIKVDSGKILVLGGMPGLAPLESRYLPFVKALKAAKPGLGEIEPVYSGFDINKATSAVAAALIAHPDLKLIIASNGPDGVAAAAAVKAANKTSSVSIIAFDAVPAEVKALKDGVITALIAQSPAGVGAAQLEALVDYIKSGKTGAITPSADFVGVPQRLLTKTNVDDPKNSDYIYRPQCK